MGAGPWAEGFGFRSDAISDEKCESQQPQTPESSYWADVAALEVLGSCKACHHS